MSSIYITPIFSDFFTSSSSKEANASIRKISQGALPIFAAAAAFRVSSSILLAIAVAVFVRNWSASSDSQPELQTSSSVNGVEKKVGNQMSKVLQQSKAEQEKLSSQVTELGNNITITGELVAQLSGTKDRYQENLSRLEAVRRKNDTCQAELKEQISLAGQQLAQLRALNKYLKQLEKARVTNNPPS